MNHLLTRSLLVFLCLSSLPCLGLAGTGAKVVKAYTDGGWVHIVTSDGHRQTIQPRKWQEGGGYESLQIAPDGKTVGWLADQMLTPSNGSVTSYSYPVALEVDIWRNGQVIRRFSPNAFAIQSWIFLKNGNEVAFHAAPAFGQEFFECTLYDVNSGKRLAHWALDRRDYVVPDWAKQLLVDNPPPGPDEISNWFPARSKRSKKAPGSPQK